MTDASKPHQGDNLLGICHHIGEALRLNPLYLRIAFALFLLINAQAALIGYAALGGVVLADKAIARAIAWQAQRRQPRGFA